jgi:twinkle protein
MVSLASLPPIEDEPDETPGPRLVSALEKLPELTDLWEKGLPPGYKTGWSSVDELYTVVPGQLSIVTGWPSSGKSEWVDALLVNLVKQGWRIAYFSPENMPIELHAAKLMEKFADAPFGRGPTQRISKEDVTKWSMEMTKKIRFIEPLEGSLSAMDVCMHAEHFLTQGNGPAGLVIDPWNELCHHRPNNLSETEYVSQTLSQVRQWARRHKVHVWIVAHPQKVRREEGILPVPKPDMISGSQHWWNKADCCIAVFRDFTKPDSPEVEIYVQKVRFKHVGKIGVAQLQYNKVTGRYIQPRFKGGYEGVRG